MAATAPTPTSARPKLPQLKTPMTSTFPSAFPSELSCGLSARTPLSAFPPYIKAEEGIKTPITPPVAYTDFLKLQTPKFARDEKPAAFPSPPSGPPTDSSSTSSTSSKTDESACSCRCSCESHKCPPASAPLSKPSPFVYPTSAPNTGRMSGRMRLHIPASPVLSAKDVQSPLSATGSALRSPFSARSPYDFDSAMKSRYFDIKSPKDRRGAVRHVREIVTRTVTYTPRMGPAPKGKRKKFDEDKIASLVSQD